MTLDQLIGLVYEHRGIDHQDERRALMTAFNGDFRAGEVTFARTDRSHYGFSTGETRAKTLFYMLEGEAWINVCPPGETTPGIAERYALVAKNGRNDRLIVPKGVTCEGQIYSPLGILVACTEPTTTPSGYNPFNTVWGEAQFQTALAPGVEELGGQHQPFTAAQLKFARVNPVNDVILGGHYHPDYREFFFILGGEAVFTTEDIESKVRAETVLHTGEHLLILPKIAHKVVVRKGTTLVGCTEKPYVSPQVNDQKYEFQ